MGSGIAQVGAQTGHSVTIIDTSEDLLAKSQSRISESIKRVAKKKFKDDAIGTEKFIQESLARLNTSTNAEKPLETADLIIESVTENLEQKYTNFICQHSNLSIYLCHVYYSNWSGRVIVRV